ncbi:MAG: MFS transporter [Verrucomicrobiota bacterium]|jgi:ACS family glucarate transporter-like MFS transporter
MSGSTTRVKRGRTRYLVLSLLFLVTAVNFGDRSMLSITGSAISKDLGLSPIALGYLLSASGWAYAAGQLPGGWLLDRFGSKRIYALSLFSWSFFVFLMAFAGIFSAGTSAIVLFALLFLMGLCEAPVFPANSRVVAAWFPTAERGTAAAVFNSAQYFAAVLFAPLMGWITHALGWKYVFLFMGLVGFAATIIWLRSIYDPRDHPRMNEAELRYIEEGGALVDLEQQRGPRSGPRWSDIKQLLSNRMLLGVYLGTYCVTAIMYFFLTWFPLYLVKGRGMSILQVGFLATLPAVCGFSGGVSGGLLSDHLLKRGHSLTFARKTPIVIGMLLATSLIACNYLGPTWAVVCIMCAAYFGKGFGSLGWAVVSDTSPKQLAGVSAGVFNMFANVAGITTPIVIGYIVKATGNFNGAMVFLAANALTTVLSYLVIVGEIRRVELKT